MDQFRIHFEDSGIYVGDEYLQATVSIGVTSVLSDNLDEMINNADELLYRAKEVGRNFVIGD